MAVDFDQVPKRPLLPVPENQLPIGSEEDSMRNVINPFRPQRKPSDYHSYLDNWNKVCVWTMKCVTEAITQGASHRLPQVLRFKSRMVPVSGQRELISPHDASRRFVVSFHVLDNTISIFEPKQPNSGIRGGTYLERTKVMRLPLTR